MKLKTIKTRGVLVVLALLYAGYAGADQQSTSRSKDLQSIVSAQDKINAKGFEQAMAESSWPVAPISPEHQEALNLMFDQNPPGDLPWDDCNFNPTAYGCTPFYSGSGNITTVASQMKDDAVQILATEVLYQTLLYFKVKNVFGKIPGKGNTYGFKVIDPVDGQPYQDLDSDTVIYAIKQFRKYVVGLLCNQPNPSRILGMMNRYDVGTRFRWDMAWALLGNDLPDAPNKYMSFGTKWRKFSSALDGIENVSIMRVKNAAGGFSPVTPDPGWGSVAGAAAGAGAAGGGAAAGGAGIVKVGFIAKEIVGMIRLVGDIVSAVLDLFCVSDLSVDKTKEQQKQDVVYKLLDVKKKAYDRYGPLRGILEDIGKKATEASGGHTVTVLP